MSLTSRQFSDTEELASKRLQTYSDGRIDRWIGLDDSGDNGHGHGHPAPAPALDLAPAEPGATPVSPSLTETATTPTPPAPTD